MLKEAFDNGMTNAFKRYKVALNFGGVMPAVRQFGAGQMSHLQGLGQGLQSGVQHGFGGGAGTQIGQSLKGLLPSMGIAAGLGIGAHALLGNRDDQRR